MLTLPPCWLTVCLSALRRLPAVTLQQDSSSSSSRSSQQSSSSQGWSLSGYGDLAAAAVAPPESSTTPSKQQVAAAVRCAVDTDAGCALPACNLCVRLSPCTLFLLACSLFSPSARKPPPSAKIPVACYTCFSCNRALQIRRHSNNNTPSLLCLPHPAVLGIRSDSDLQQRLPGPPAAAVASYYAVSCCAVLCRASGLILICSG